MCIINIYHIRLAVNTVDFFNEISLLYGTITEFCTPQTCPTMSAGPQFEYLWADKVKVKKPIKVSAPEYVDLLMSWVKRKLPLLLFYLSLFYQPASTTSSLFCAFVILIYYFE